MPLSNLGTVRPESQEERDAGAIVTNADIVEVWGRAQAFKTPGEIPNPAGLYDVTSGAKTKALLLATKESTGIFGAFWDWLTGQNK